MEDHITLDLLAKFPALSPGLFKKDITVRITGERIVQARNFIMLENNEGIGIEFPNELIKVNGLQILPDSRLELTAALYDHWFNKKDSINGNFGPKSYIPILTRFGKNGT